MADNLLRQVQHLHFFLIINSMPMKYFTPDDLQNFLSDVSGPSSKTIEIIRIIAHTYRLNQSDTPMSASCFN